MSFIVYLSYINNNNNFFLKSLKILKNYLKFLKNTGG